MQIQFEDNELQELQDIFNALDPMDSIFMNHYTLANVTGVSADRWKVFLMHPRVSTFIEQELQLFTQYQLKQMIKDATDDKRSVAAPQMINALSKSLENNRIKEGPIIIYTHVPLTEQQEQGTSIETMRMEENILAAIPTWED